MSLFRRRDRQPGASVEGILSVLSRVMDPELGRDLVSLSMIRNVCVSGGDVSLDLVLTTPACPKKEEMKEAVTRAVMSVPGVSSVDVRISAEVKAAKDPMEGRRPVPGVKNILAVASGKGGSESRRSAPTSRWLSGKRAPVWGFWTPTSTVLRSPRS